MKCLSILMIVIFLLLMTPTYQIGANEKRYYVCGDEPLGGVSYMAAICNGSISPEEDDPYLRLFGEIKKLDVWEYDITSEEYDILVRITEAEATGGTIKQKMNVASCVLARMESPNWPNDIRSVVFQKRQFSPIDDGRYYTVKIQQSTEEAVDEVLHYGKTHDCLWFCSDGSYNKKNLKGEYCSYHRLNHTWSFYDGEHHYFYD